MKKTLILLFVCVIFNTYAQKNPKYLQVKLPVTERLDDLINELTTDEKIDMLAGYKDFYFHPVERLKIPGFIMADGPLGVASWGIHGRATAFPAAMLQAATWNRKLMAELGNVYGEEWRSRGLHYFLGPGVNIYRASKAGRNFEYFGEDPYLTSQLVVPFINAIQTQGVAAVIKHFVGNEQEFNRYQVNSIIDERTLNEIYLAPFKAAVQNANVMGVMAAYNPINGEWNTQSKSNLTDVLRKKWGFKGVVMSDWACTFSTVESANNGLDMEMGSYDFFTRDKMNVALKEGKVTMRRLNEMVRNIFYPAIRLGFFDRLQLDSNIAQFNSKSFEVAKKTASEGIVLLKNKDHLLPLTNHTKSIVIFGKNANPEHYSDRVIKATNDFIVGGGGSSKVNPWYEVSTLQGLLNQTESADIQYDDGNNIDKAVAIAKNSDVVIVSAGFNSGSEVEGVDRPFDLPERQNDLIKALVIANPKTIVIINAGGGVNMSKWVNDVPVILHSFYAGSEGGNALAEIIFGKVNPSGKLPFSIECRWEDAPAYGNYDENYISKKDTLNVNYNEGLLVGYRHFDAKKIAPLFPFGHGLSYTTFTYQKIAVELDKKRGANVIFSITNKGNQDGYEVAQVYLQSIDSKVSRPVKELKGFDKIWIAKGETKEVSIYIPQDSFSYYDVDIHDWKVAPGEYKVLVGASSNDIQLQQSVFVK